MAKKTKSKPKKPTKELKLTPEIIYDTIEGIFDGNYIHISGDPFELSVDITYALSMEDQFNWFHYPTESLEQMQAYFLERHEDSVRNFGQHVEIHSMRLKDVDSDPDYYMATVVLNGYRSDKTTKVATEVRG